MSAPKWLPDWRDASQYPDKSTASSVRWGWEFLRRNPKYQAFYDEYVRPFVLEGTIDYDAAMLYEEKMKHEADKIGNNNSEAEWLYGIEGLAQKEFGILSVVAPEDNYTPTFPHQKTRIIMASDSEYRELPVTIFKEELLVYFRLDLPLKWQLKRAENLMSRCFESRAPTDERYRPSSYQNYLRMLDAKASEIANADIARVIYKCTKESDGYSSAIQKVQHGLERAKLLRDKDYCRIAIGSVR